MYTQFFGNYLLNKNVITQEQLLAALDKQATTRVKIGALAIHAGYMTASEVEQIFIMQTHQDKRFGELAIEKGYLSQKQLDELLDLQLPDYIILGQILADQGILTPVQLERHITDYRSEYEILDLDLNSEQKDMVEHLLENINFEESALQKEYVIDYLLLLFNNLIRFIGNDYTPLNILKLSEIPTAHCVTQDMGCPIFHVSSALDTDEATAIAFASRYAHDEFSEFDEFVRASMEDFVNLHNGLFLVNMSNNYSIEMTLQPPIYSENKILETSNTTYLFPILFPFGMINFICSIYEMNPEE